MNEMMKSDAGVPHQMNEILFTQSGEEVKSGQCIVKPSIWHQREFNCLWEFIASQNTFSEEYITVHVPTFKPPLVFLAPKLKMLRAQSSLKAAKKLSLIKKITHSFPIIRKTLYTSSSNTIWLPTVKICLFPKVLNWRPYRSSLVLALLVTRFYIP